ncbi:MAG: hypothetical protein ACFE8B_09035 [Candidatus Hermodarchaeota archaeon]
MHLFDLLNKDKYPSLSDYEFYDVVGETYKLNLDYNLNLKMLFIPIYKDLKKRIKKLHGKEKKFEMEKYLDEKYGLRYPETPKPSSSVVLYEKLRLGLIILVISVSLILTGVVILSEINPLILISIVVIIFICAGLDQYCR